MRRSILLALVVTASFGLSGCDDNSSVKGVVKLDGTPVEGATVTFVSEDGNSTYIGVSDASGNFTLTSSTGGKKGAPAGTYKVTVVKGAKFSGDLTPGGADAMKNGQKEQAQAAAKGKMGPAMRPGAPGVGSGVKSELPELYATAKSTPLTVKVPLDTQPVVLDLKSK